jgi:hypothetical protein
MAYLLQTNAYWRSPRVRLAVITPAVVRLPDGCRRRGKLKIVSLTGGLLTVSNVLDRGSRIKLMFLTRAGPVLGAAEMLTPVSTTHQSFRFVALEEDDQSRLRALIQTVSDHGERAWIEKYRAALVQRNSPKRRILRPFLGALTVITLCLGTAIYLMLRVH